MALLTRKNGCFHMIRCTATTKGSVQGRARSGRQRLRHVPLQPKL